MAPQGFEKPETCLVGILQGMEMGLSPLFALQRMAIVDGRLTIWGDGALALVLRSGLCVSITEWLEGNDESEWISHCEVLREGWDRPITRSFAVQDAKRANLWHKPGPWTEYPKRMLQMRARAFTLRVLSAPHQPASMIRQSGLLDMLGADLLPDRAAALERAQHIGAAA